MYCTAMQIQWQMSGKESCDERVIIERISFFEDNLISDKSLRKALRIMERY